jgi:mRNA interferase MazF
VAVTGQRNRKSAISRGEVHLVDLDPTRGSEIRKTRPCVVVSPDELNHHLNMVMVAPLTTGRQPYPWRVSCQFAGRSGSVVIDQLRTVDTERLVKRLGTLDSVTFDSVLTKLQEVFSR